MNRDQLNAQISAEFGGPAIDAWPTAPGGRMRPHKGGDGGAGAAQKQEADRQARIRSAVDMINNVFNGGEATSFDGKAYLAANPDVAASAMYGSDPEAHYRDWGQAEGRAAPMTTTNYGAVGNRETLYNDQKQAVTDLNRREVDRQYGEAERANRFGLARSGLLGGSADIDSNADLQRRTNEGIIQATALGDQAAADLRSSDERTRQSLISMAQSGIDTGTAQQTALAGLNANAQTAAGARGGATVGNLFSDLSQAYLANQVNAGRAAATGATGQPWYAASSPQQSYGGSTSR